MAVAAHGPLVPAWTFRPGPDIAPEAPPGLRLAQAIAKEAAAAGLAAAVPGASEQEVEIAVADCLRAGGAEGIWTITNVGLGANAHICFPTHPPTALRAEERDVIVVDVHPIAAGGFWGDCTRSKVIGDNPDALSALADLEALHYDALARLRPGMPASELFGMVNERLSSEGFVLLDLLANIGHSLSAGGAYMHGYIDAKNDSPMWGAWAIEPFARRGEIAVKVEDLVWFGRERCEVL